MTNSRYDEDGYREAGRVGRGLCTALLVGVASVSVASAQDAGNNGAVSVSAGIDFSNAYYFRGIIQETEGFIAQPFLEAGISLFEGDGGVQSVSVTSGLWNSLHSGPSGSDGPGDPAMWYETDYYASLGFGFAEGWSADLTYTAYMSPNGTFGTVKELSTGVAYEDEFGLAPYATLAFELDGQADGGLNEGTYLELGVGPGLAIPDSPVGLSFPVTIGLSLSDYYETSDSSDAFGFFQVGVVAGLPLPAAPEYGSWELSLGINFIAFGDALKQINGADDGFEPVAIVGLSLSY